MTSLEKTFNNLTAAQQLVIAKICQGYPLAILNALTIRKLHEAGVMANNELPDLAEWGVWLGLTDDDIADPVWVTLDSLSRNQLRILAQMMGMDNSSEARDSSATIACLKQYGVLELNSSRRLHQQRLF